TAARISVAVWRTSWPRPGASLTGQGSDRTLRLKEQAAPQTVRRSLFGSTDAVAFVVGRLLRGYHDIAHQRGVRRQIEIACGHAIGLEDIGLDIGDHASAKAVGRLNWHRELDALV